MRDCKGEALEPGDLVVIRARVVDRLGDPTVWVRHERGDGSPGDLHSVWLSEVEKVKAEVSHGA